MPPRTKGHWPRGKPRHPPIPPARLARVVRWFAQHHLTGVDNERSIHRVALRIGVSDRAVRRWLAGTHNPAPDHWRDLIAQLDEYGW